MTDELEPTTADQADLEAIIRELNTDEEYKLPAEAFVAARQHREQIIPHLIQLIADATEEVRTTKKYKKEQGHFFALFLLGEFQAKEALPTIVEAICLPERGPFHLFGDAVHEVIPRILAMIAHDQLDVFVSLLHNSDANMYVRVAAATALVKMVGVGVQPREKVVQILREALRAAMDEGDPQLIAFHVAALADLYPEEALEDIKEAFEVHVVETFIVDMDSVEGTLKERKEPTLQKLAKETQYLNDSVKELRGWASFNKPVPKPKPIPEELKAQLPKPKQVPKKPKPTPRAIPSASSAVNTKQVGRNDPCPCGSGKKFKKCCRAK